MNLKKILRFSRSLLLCSVFFFIGLSTESRGNSTAQDISVSSWLSARGQKGWGALCNELKNSVLSGDTDKAVFDTGFSKAPNLGRIFNTEPVWWMTVTPGFRIPIPKGNYKFENDHALRLHPNPIMISLRTVEDAANTDMESKPAESTGLKSLFGHEMNFFDLQKLPYGYKLADLNCNANTTQGVDEAEKAGVALLVKKMNDGAVDPGSIKVYQDVGGIPSLLKVGHLKGNPNHLFIDIFVRSSAKTKVVSYKLGSKEDFSSVLASVLSMGKAVGSRTESPPAWIVQAEKNFLNSSKTH